MEDPLAAEVRSVRPQHRRNHDCQQEGEDDKREHQVTQDAVLETHPARVARMTYPHCPAEDERDRNANELDGNKHIVFFL
jgi:hypothetical protein